MFTAGVCGGPTDIGRLAFCTPSVRQKPRTKLGKMMKKSPSALFDILADDNDAHRSSRVRQSIDEIRASIPDKGHVSPSLAPLAKKTTKSSVCMLMLLERRNECRLNERTRPVGAQEMSRAPVKARSWAATARAFLHFISLNCFLVGESVG